MGLFNRAPRVDDVQAAYDRGRRDGETEGFREGVVAALEAYVAGIDEGLRHIGDDHPVRPFLQEMRRSAKETAARV